MSAFNASRAVPGAERKEELVDEATAAILEFENGAMGVMLATALATGRKNVLSWEINGAQGSLRWNLEHPNSLLACLGSGEECALSGFKEICVTDNEHPYASAWWPTGHTLGWEHAHIIEKAQFLGGIASGANMSSCLATFEDGYRVSVIIAAMKESSRSGKRVLAQY